MLKNVNFSHLFVVFVWYLIPKIIISSSSTNGLSIIGAGPVYLENREREVVYASRHGLVWQKGVLTQREHFIKVVMSLYSNFYFVSGWLVGGIK